MQYDDIKYPFPTCEHPVVVRSHGIPQLVPCGSCPVCESQKRTRLSTLLQIEEYRSKYCVFITLTYDEDNLPVYDFNELYWNHQNYPNDTYMAIPNHLVIKDEKICTPRHFTWSPELAKELDIYNNHRSLYKKKYSVCKNVTYEDNVVAVLVSRHLQLFLKRLRKYINKEFHEKVRFYAIGEYGTNSFRPHWHLLLFYNSTELFRAFEDVEEVGTTKRPVQCAKFLRSLWKFGLCSSATTDKSAYYYVSGYVTGSSRLPKFLKLLAPPRAYHSVHLGEVYEKEDVRNKLLKRDFDNIASIDVYNKDGSVYTKSFMRTLLSRLLPRFSFIDGKDNALLFRQLTSYERLKSYCTSMGSILDLSKYMYNVWKYSLPCSSVIRHFVYDVFIRQVCACEHSDQYLLSPLTSALYASKRFLHASVEFNIDKFMLFDIYKDYYSWKEKKSLGSVLAKCELDSHFAALYYGSIGNLTSTYCSLTSYFSSTDYKDFISLSHERYNKSIKHRSQSDRYKFNQ